MIDIHNHILPGVDDGSASLDESLSIARIAVEQGISIMFATPHIITRQNLLSSMEYPDRTAQLQRSLDENGIRLQLLSGAEVYPSHNIPQYLRDGYPLTLGGYGRYLLIDSPLTKFPMAFDELVFTIQTMGYNPILAHPERASSVQYNLSILEGVVRRGLLIQINASSIASSSELTRNTARALLDLNWVHFVASDSHSSRHRRPALGHAYKDLLKIVGEGKANELVEDNGRRVVESEPVPSNPLPYKPMGRSWFSKLFGR